MKKGIALYKKSLKDPELSRLLNNKLGLKYQIGMDIAGGYSKAETMNRIMGSSLIMFRL